ncbi:MAG: diacylglycerol kinase family protein [Sediminicola sp.]
MKNAFLIHNPTAGDSQHNKEMLLEKISRLGFQVRYVSTDAENWKGAIKDPTDAFFLAGGDGTVHKVAKVLLQDREPTERIVPIHLIAMGTANNIVKSLLNTTSIKKGELPLTGLGTKFDCGLVQGIPDHNFFLESMGLGIFPELIAQMKNEDTAGMDPDEKLKRTLEVLLKLVSKFPAQNIKMRVDGIVLKGSFLLVELMNIRYIGPNLDLAPLADVGDGFFDLVLIPESARADFAAYLKQRLKTDEYGKEMGLFTKTLRVKKMALKCPECKFHVDDALVKDISGKRIGLSISQDTFTVMA